MNYITEKEKKISVLDSCDVFVAGGGIAGVSAALAAARNGAKVILAEKQCILGGLATAGIITFYLPICDGNGKQVEYGIAEELLRLSIAYGADDLYPKAWLEDGSMEERAKNRFKTRFNPSVFALDMERILVEAGVKILYDTRICDVFVEDKSIKSIIVENKTGRCAYSVKSVVDATGDADIAKFAGAETSVYERQNVLAAWNYYHANGKVNLRLLGAADVTHGDMTKVDPLSDMKFSGIDGEENSKMLILSHKKIMENFVENRSKDPEYALNIIPTMPQLRMTRCLIGDYKLDEADKHKEFEDSVGLISNWRKPGPIYEIPLRSLYSKDIKNLISAGRCISTTDEMWNITRVIPSCAVTGQAAGTAAAMSSDFRNMDIKTLQKKLRDANVRLHEKEL